MFCRGNALHDDEMSLLFMLIVSGSVVIIFLTRFFTGFLFSYVIGRLNTTVRLSTPTLITRFYIVE